MAFHKLSVIFCSILILQTRALSQDQAVSQQESANVSNIIDIVEFIVKIAESIIDSILITISKTLDELIVEPAILQTKLVAFFKKVLDIMAVAADKQMNIIKENGNPDTKVILGCIQAEEDKIKTMVLAIIDKHSKCFVNGLVALEKSVQSIVGDLQKVQGDFKMALTKLDTCHGDDQQAITCALGVAADTIKVMKEIPDITSKDIHNLTEIVFAFPKYLITCVKPNIQTLQADVMEVIDDISSCSRKP